MVLDTVVPVSNPTLAFGPDNVLALSRDGTVQLLDATNGQLKWFAESSDRAIINLAFSPDGSRLAASGNGGTTRIYDADTGETLSSLVGRPEDRAQSMAFTSGSMLVLTPTSKPVIALYSNLNAQPEKMLAGHRLRVELLTIEKNTDQIISAGPDLMVKVWQPDRGPAVDVQPVSEGHDSSAVAVSPDGRITAIGCFDATLILSHKDRSRFEIKAHEPGILALAFSPAGDRLVTAGTNDCLRLWDPQHGEEVAASSPRSQIMSVAYSPDGKWILSGSTFSSQGVVIHDSQTLEQVASLNALHPAAFAPDGSAVVAQSADKQALLAWRTGTWEPMGILARWDENITRLVLAPQSDLFLTVEANVVQVRSLADGSVRRTIRPEKNDAVLALSISPDGERILITTKNLTLWDTLSGQEVFRVMLDKIPSNRPVRPYFAAHDDGGRDITVALGPYVGRWLAPDPR